MSLLKLDGMTDFQARERIKSLWISSLRSGDYTQTVRRLKDWDGTCFCGLGLLYESLRVSGLASDPWISCSYGYGVGSEFVQEIEEVLGVDVRWLDNVIRLNDYQTYSFLEIADWLEVNL